MKKLVLAIATLFMTGSAFADIYLEAGSAIMLPPSKDSTRVTCAGTRASRPTCMLSTRVGGPVIENAAGTIIYPDWDRDGHPTFTQIQAKAAELIRLGICRF